MRQAETIRHMRPALPGVSPSGLLSLDFRNRDDRRIQGVYMTFDDGNGGENVRMKVATQREAPEKRGRCISGVWVCDDLEAY